ncbi:organic cation/carnitine transporter 1 [Dioscorea cayenensis subsp. rotundata]|uniref:H(+)/Pi cotransporter n=1 Tax=Dioscorea cayennensis subsp. rotundata TaxID=55577 RepID=A0AB40CFS2_DIOCR|nr:organic cation/carnitine transporter 1 [Dioscorea cayenensis subsp. rotundata]
MADDQEIEVKKNVEGIEEGFNETNTSTNLELTVNEIIEQHVGSFGLSQLLQVFLVSLAWVFDAHNTLVTVFTDSQPAWKCKVAASSSCSLSAGMCGLAPGTWDWVGGHKSSTIAEWGLICGHKFRAGVPASMYFIGSLFGSITQGQLADMYLGRKKTIVLSCLLTAITSFLTSFSPNVWVYAFLRFTNGFARSGIGICCLVLSTEAVGRKWRGQVGNYGFFFYALGFLSLPLIAYTSRTSWRNIYRIISLFPLIYSFFLTPFISESPRWLILKGRTDEAMQVLNKLAKFNGNKLPKNLTIINPSVTVNSTKTKKLWSVSWAAKRMVALMVAGFGVGFVYYGVQLNVENLNFNLYYTVAANALMEIPAVLIGSVLLGCMDRRVIFSSASILAGVSSILCILFAKKNKSKRGWGQLGLEAVGFMTASMAFDVLYIYCAELFPTNVRNFSVSMLRQTLMLGGAIAPVLVVVGRLSPAFSFLVFGVLAIFSGVVTVWLPETKHAPLYETFEQQEKEEKLGASSDGVEMVESTRS